MDPCRATTTMMKSKSGSKEENLPRPNHATPSRRHRPVPHPSILRQPPAGTWLERGLQCVREATSLPSGFQARGGCCYSWPAKGDSRSRTIAERSGAWCFPGRWSGFQREAARRSNTERGICAGSGSAFSEDSEGLERPDTSSRTPAGVVLVGWAGTCASSSRAIRRWYVGRCAPTATVRPKNRQHHPQARAARIHRR